MKKAINKIITSLLVTAALSTGISSACLAATETITTIEKTTAETVSFEQRYDLTDTIENIEGLDYSGIKEVESVDEWRDYVIDCINRGYHTIFLKAPASLQFEINTLMGANDILGSRTRTITSGSTKVVCYTLDFTYSHDILTAVKNGTIDKLDSKKTAALNKAKTVVAAIPADADDYDKSLAIHDYICETMVYNKDKANNDNIIDCYGALILGRGNCMAYTDAYNLLCGLAGLETGIVTGVVSGGAHSWNWIRLDGEYYFTDCTFDDGIESKRGYDYLYMNIPYSVMAKNHTAENLTFQVDVTKELDNNSYYVRNGLYADSPAALKALFEKYADSQGFGSFLFDTSNGCASLVDFWREHHPAQYCSLNTSKFNINDYEIIGFTMS